MNADRQQPRTRTAAFCGLLVLAPTLALAVTETTATVTPLTTDCAVSDARPSDLEDLEPTAVAAEKVLQEGPELMRAVIETSPGSLGSLSIGSPDAGLLVNPLPFPEGALWTVRNPVETYATAETIAFITAAVEAVEGQFPGSPRLVIGDISRADGGRLNRHRSHQSGRDADIGFYFRSGERDDFARGTARSLDVNRTWALVRAFVTDTDVERVFVDRSIQRVLFDHAVSIGEDRGWLDDIFGRRTAGIGAIIQHERRHQDHMHVRFYNARAQDCGRLAYPHLVKAGVVPGPTLMHRVRPGETLSHLARRYGTSVSAIRSANGLRGSTLRAGRRYVIPVRRVPAPGEPIVVPPRRLPPDLQAFAGESPAEEANPRHAGAVPETR